MDLSRWLINTDDIEAQLLDAQAQNASVEKLVAALEGQPDHVVTAALNAAFPGTVAPVAPAPARTRAPKAEVEANVALLLKHADGEGQTARQLRTLTGLDADAFRTASIKLSRTDPPRLICEGKLWRLP